MPDVKSLLPGRAFRSEHAQLRPEPHSIASHGPDPMDPLQTTRMRNGVLYAAEWPCCHDPLRLSPSRPICCRPASITHRWRRQPPPLGRASATRSPLWLSVRSAHTARARPIARASHLRLNPAHRAHNTTQHNTAQHTRAPNTHARVPIGTGRVPPLRSSPAGRGETPSSRLSPLALPALRRHVLVMPNPDLVDAPAHSPPAPSVGSYILNPRSQASDSPMPYTRYAFIACACRFRERVQLRDVVGTPRSRRRR